MISPVMSPMFAALLPLDVATAFFATAVILAIAPGPDNIFVLTQSMLYNAKAGMAATLGFACGLTGHTAAVALGVAAFFQNSPTAFTVLKMVGAAYLLYLAWLTFRSGSMRADAEQRPFPGYLALFRRGVIMNITNPKVTLFCLAFWPQFAVPSLGHLPWQIVQLGALFMLATLLVFGVVALLGGQLAQWLNRSPQYQILMNRVAALVFVGMAAALLFT